jgi:hypothetical protein
MSIEPMKDDEQTIFVAQGFEFGRLVSKLTTRAIDAETLAQSLQTTVHLQEAQIASLQKRLAKAKLHFTYLGAGCSVFASGGVAP